MKKIKKIILMVIVSLIALISVFSCFKGKYTPEPILNTVSVLKPANSSNNNVINPSGTYDYIYFNTSLNDSEIINIITNLTGVVLIGNEEYFIISNQSEGTAYPEKFVEVLINRNDNIYAISIGETTDDIIWSYGYENRVNGWSNNLENPLTIGYKSYNSYYSSYLDVTISIGQQNNLLTNLISPTPFLFEGTSSSVAWTSSGLDNPNNIQDIYFNANLTNQAIKNILDTYIGETAGVDIFYYLDAGVRVSCRVINNSANAFIQIIGGTTTLYKWIYDSIDTDEYIWWYGIGPAIIDNGNVIISPRGNSLNGFNIYELKALFSSENDFTETPSGDSYKQGYQDGYTAGETAGYNSGYTAGETAGYNSGYTAGETAGYNSGYTAGETAGETAGYNQGYTAGETAGYNQGYLDGLDDGAGSNINFQYIESVLTLIGNFLNIEILPNIKLSYALGIIIILSVISIIKMVVK